MEDPTIFVAEVKKIVTYLNKQEYELNEDTNRRDWEMVSRVFDRVCMIFFFVVCIILVVYNAIDLCILKRQAEEDFETYKDVV